MEKIAALLETEKKSVTILRRYDSAASDATSGTLNVGSSNNVQGADAWLEVRVDPELYRRLEDGVRLITECNVYNMILCFCKIRNFVTLKQ
jgi:hypothetical protein